MSNNAHELSNRLLNALDNNYNVVDMHTVNEIISVLERINITKELLETTRLGKHVNELRRKTTDPTLARRAKVLVKRWRDLVIPTVASPGQTASNRSSAERQVRQRLGGTPLTSPALALARQVVSPAVNSPRPPSRPAWGGYESDSQDVILVDDDPPPPPPPAPLAAPAPLSNAAHKPLTPPVKRPPTPEPLHDEKKAKRDKKLKKKSHRGHGRAGSGTEAPAHPAAPPGAPAAPSGAPGALSAPAAWGARNGSHERRRNGCRRDAVDPYAALVNRMPPAGAKKVKTTQELLEQIQSRGSKPVASPGSPDVMLIEPDDSPQFPMKPESPMRNGSGTPRESPAPSPPPVERPLSPLEDERPFRECTCGEEIADEDCPAAPRRQILPFHVHALHHTFLPGVNGTRAPPEPHKFAVRKAEDPERPGLFTSVVPLYKYSDYADDFCVKNMSRVPLCTHLPWTEFAPPPPDPPPPPSPPPLRPYPFDPEPKETDETEIKTELDTDVKDIKMEVEVKDIIVEAEAVGVPNLEPSERLKAPILSAEDESQFSDTKRPVEMEVQEEFASEIREHRTVERTKDEPLDGRALFETCRRAIDSVPYDYAQTSVAPVVTLPEAAAEVEPALEDALRQAEDETQRDDLSRPARPARFAEWHECIRLGPLLALPYVVID